MTRINKVRQGMANTTSTKPDLLILFIWMDKKLASLLDQWQPLVGLMEQQQMQQR
jgi:hypothetical protein